MSYEFYCDLVNYNDKKCFDIHVKVIESLNDISELKAAIIIIDPRISYFIRDLQIKKDKIGILAIGSFDVINFANLGGKYINKHRITVVPIPLTNDSFCMGRCSTNAIESSFECSKPYKIYLSLKENMILGTNLLKIGLGEAISTICSLSESLRYNYSIRAYKSEIVKLIKYIVKETEFVLNASNVIESERLNIIYRKVFSLLLTKCNLRYILGSNMYIARSDHSIGRILESKFNIPHGVAVTLACYLIKDYILDTYSAMVVSKLLKSFAIDKKILNYSHENFKRIVLEATKIRKTCRHPLLVDILEKLK